MEEVKKKRIRIKKNVFKNAEFVDKLNEDSNFKNVILNSHLETAVNSFSKEYSFNIDSELFPMLTSEQQKLWKKEIEYAIKAGAEYSVKLLQSKCTTN